ncbi:carbonic anhydrase [Roseovarius tibetensis]|uniref:carbonic anhydrase n=1 Tax=Roseovarius tibetensis TaxID=2685897 RepID=UPI003D7FD12C
MEHARPLPTYLVHRYHGWKATTYAENKAWYRHLAEQGQHPRAMVISCCDSRVHVTSIFGADQGEFFIHRNIANLVPPFETAGGQHGTSAALEFAVTALSVAHVIVIGHSACGGARGCQRMCAGTAPDLEQETSFVGRWLEILRPGYERVRDIADTDAQLHALERQTVVVSLDNLMSFPFVADRVTDGTLTLHGLWHDIGSGGLEQYDAVQDRFQPL